MVMVVAVATSALLAGCGGSSTSSTTTTVAPAATTTTLTAAQLAVLQPKLLTVADFPPGWTVDTAPDAAGTKNTPDCVANVVLAKGSTTRATAVFLGPKDDPALIQTVASFESGQVAKSSKSLRAGFLACDGDTLQLGDGQSARLGTGQIAIGPTGNGGFAAEMIITEGSAHNYLYVFVGVKGDFDTAMVWRATTKSNTLFAETAAKALAQL